MPAPALLVVTFTEAEMHRLDQPIVNTSRVKVLVGVMNRINRTTRTVELRPQEIPELKELAEKERKRGAVLGRYIIVVDAIVRAEANNERRNF